MIASWAAKSKLMRAIRDCTLVVAMCAALSCASSQPVPPKPGTVLAPTVTHRVEPDYPVELRQQRVTGVVVIGGTVPKEGGTLRNPRVIRSDDSRLTQLALEAVSRWMWKPGLLDGQPVDVEFRTQVRFSVEQ